LLATKLPSNSNLTSPLNIQQLLPRNILVESESTYGHGLEPGAQKQFGNSFAVQDHEMFALNIAEFFHIASYAYILVQTQCDTCSHI